MIDPAEIPEDHFIVEQWDTRGNRIIWKCIGCCEGVAAELPQYCYVLEDILRLFRLRHPGPIQRIEPA